MQFQFVVFVVFVEKQFINAAFANVHNFHLERAKCGFKEDRTLHGQMKRHFVWAHKGEPPRDLWNLICQGEENFLVDNTDTVDIETVTSFSHSEIVSIDSTSVHAMFEKDNNWGCADTGTSDMHVDGAQMRCETTNMDEVSNEPLPNISCEATETDQCVQSSGHTDCNDEEELCGKVRIDGIPADQDNNQ